MMGYAEAVTVRKGQARPGPERRVPVRYGKAWFGSLGGLLWGLVPQGAVGQSRHGMTGFVEVSLGKAV